MNNLALSIGNTFFGGSNTFGGGTSGSSLNGIGSLVSLFLNIAFVVASIILLFFFILGGIGMIISAGQDDPQKVEQSKKTITSAIIGFVIVFVSYWIVKLVAQLLGISNLIF
ncbi:MAG: hypothetical protein ABSC49_00680 [Candidatus Microgenomates bacterium]